MISKSPKGSKFGFINQSRQNATDNATDQTPTESPSEAKAEAPVPSPPAPAKSKAQPKTSAKAQPKTSAKAQSKTKAQPKVKPQTKPPAKLGRPKGGKRSDPNYEQITAYIRKDTHKAIKKRLLDDSDRDFSDLVQDLLEEYLSDG